MTKRPHIRAGKLGRNDPCFCGSGLKYKKCCLPKGNTPPRPISEVPPEILAKWQEGDAKIREVRNMGIYINLPNTIGFKGKRVLAVANGILLDGTENTTFHELILRDLQRTLGKDWWDGEMAKKPDDRHFIMKCYEEFGKFTAEASTKRPEGDGRWSAIPNGYAHYILNLAFDIYVLKHKNSLPDAWIERLKQRDQYQGVRYEIAVASIFARIDCTLEFYESSAIKRPEFIATHAETSNRVAVEAKSRHRGGVIHQTGSFDLAKAMKGDITQLFNQALAKEVDGLPYMIFIDVNAPRDLSEKTIKTKWFADVKKMMGRTTPTPTEPDKQNLLCVTNYSHHYEEDRLITPGQNCMVVPLYSEAPLADGIEGVFLGKLQQAINGYGYIPNL